MTKIFAADSGALDSQSSAQKEIKEHHLKAKLQNDSRLKCYEAILSNLNDKDNNASSLNIMYVLVGIVTSFLSCGFFTLIPLNNKY